MGFVGGCCETLDMTGNSSLGYVQLLQIRLATRVIRPTSPGIASMKKTVTICFKTKTLRTRTWDPAKLTRDVRAFGSGSGLGLGPTHVVGSSTDPW